MTAEYSSGGDEWGFAARRAPPPQARTSLSLGLNLSMMARTSIDVDGFYMQQHVISMMQVRSDPTAAAARCFPSPPQNADVRMQRNNEEQMRAPSRESTAARNTRIHFLIGRMGDRDKAATIIQRAFRAMLQRRQAKHKAFTPHGNVIQHHLAERVFKCNPARLSLQLPYFISNFQREMLTSSLRRDDADAAVADADGPAPPPPPLGAAPELRRPFRPAGSDEKGAANGLKLVDASKFFSWNSGTNHKPQDVQPPRVEPNRSFPARSASIKAKPTLLSIAPIHFQGADAEAALRRPLPEPEQADDEPQGRPGFSPRDSPAASSARSSSTSSEAPPRTPNRSSWADGGGGGCGGASPGGGGGGSPQNVSRGSSILSHWSSTSSTGSCSGVAAAATGDTKRGPAATTLHPVPPPPDKSGNKFLAFFRVARPRSLSVMSSGSDEAFPLGDAFRSADGPSQGRGLPLLGGKSLVPNLATCNSSPPDVMAAKRDGAAAGRRSLQLVPLAAPRPASPRLGKVAGFGGCRSILAQPLPGDRAALGPALDAGGGPAQYGCLPAVPSCMATATPMQQQQPKRCGARMRNSIDLPYGRQAPTLSAFA